MLKRNSKLNFLNGAALAVISFLLISPLSIGFAAFMSIGILLMSLGVIPMAVGVLGLNYVPSNLVKAQAKLLMDFGKGELRAIDPVTFKAFQRNNEIMMPSHKVLRTREDRALEAYFMQRTARALGNGRSHNPTGNTGNTGVLTPSFVTYNDKFSISMKQANNNVYAFEEMFNNEIANVLKNFQTGNETNATNFLYNNRSAVNVAVSEGVFNAVTNSFEIIESNNGQRSIQITDGAMAENLYGGMTTTVFCDSISYNKFAFLSKQGAENATNTSFQFEGKTFVRSLYLTAKAIALGYTKGFWIAVPDGTISVLDWIPIQNRQGVVKAPSRYSSFINPIDGLTYAVFDNYIAQDSTASNGYTQDILENYEFSIDLGFEAAPLSNAGETTIQAFALV